MNPNITLCTLLVCHSEECEARRGSLLCEMSFRTNVRNLCQTRFVDWFDSPQPDSLLRCASFRMTSLWKSSRTDSHVGRKRPPQNDKPGALYICHSEGGLCPTVGDSQYQPHSYGLRRYTILTPPHTPPSGGAVVAALRVGRGTVSNEPEYRALHALGLSLRGVR